MSAMDHKAAAGLGDRLRQARVALGLSAEDVASRLRLSTRHIDALETENFASLPGATYVRGYIRAYSSVVGLDARPLLDAYEARQAPKELAREELLVQAVAPLEERFQTEEEMPVFPWTAWFTLSGVVVAVVVAGVWLWSKVEPSGKVVRGGVSAQQAGLHPVFANHVTLPPNVPGPARSEETPAPAAQARPVVPVVSHATPVVHPPLVPTPRKISRPRPTPTPKGTGLLGPAKSTTAPRPTAAAAHRAQPVVSAVVPAARPKTSTATNGPVYGRVSLALGKPAMVTIRDGSGMTLLHEALPAGLPITLGGMAPLHIDLSNAQGADLRFDGAPVDLRQWQSGQPAHLTLGGSASP